MCKEKCSDEIKSRCKSESVVTKLERRGLKQEIEGLVGAYLYDCDREGNRLSGGFLVDEDSPSRIAIDVLELFEKYRADDDGMMLCDICGKLKPDVDFGISRPMLGRGVCGECDKLNYSPEVGKSMRELWDALEEQQRRWKE